VGVGASSGGQEGEVVESCDGDVGEGRGGYMGAWG